MAITITDMRKDGLGEYVATVTVTPDWFSRLVLRQKPRTVYVFGSGTVWRNSTNGSRVLAWEGLLADACTMHRRHVRY